MTLAYTPERGNRPQPNDDFKTRVIGGSRSPHCYCSCSLYESIGGCYVKSRPSIRKSPCKSPSPSRRFDFSQTQSVRDQSADATASGIGPVFGRYAVNDHHHSVERSSTAFNAAARASREDLELAKFAYSGHPQRELPGACCDPDFEFTFMRMRSRVNCRGALAIVDSVLSEPVCWTHVMIAETPSFADITLVITAVRAGDCPLPKINSRTSVDHVVRRSVAKEIGRRRGKSCQLVKCDRCPKPAVDVETALPWEAETISTAVSENSC